MLPHFVSDAHDAVPLRPVTEAGLAAELAGLDAAQRRWIAATGFTGAAGKLALLPDGAGGLARVLVGTAAGEPFWTLAALPEALPAGHYALEGVEDPAAAATQMALGWALGSYAFTRYKSGPERAANLVWPARADRARVERLARGIFLARDLINTPAEDLGPAELAAAAAALAQEHGASCRVIVGDDLLRENYPAIHMVGRGSVRAPRLIDLVWGDPAAPKLTLVGKGVCFDSGGYDLKPAGGMRLMKKDMGGAATVLGLASAVMAAGLKLRLRVLVPAVENSVSGNAMRPLDVIRTRQGMTVEIGDTDAEGRLILGDALCEACAEKPDLLIDMATLTGAARSALGPDLPALFANDDAAAEALLAAGVAARDPLWRLPLWRPYRQMMQSKIADLNSIGDSGFAGAIIAALYLDAFVAPETPWIHIDTYAWNAKSRPGRPEGGEALALRALYAMIETRFAHAAT